MSRNKTLSTIVQSFAPPCDGAYGRAQFPGGVVVFGDQLGTFHLQADLG